MCVCAESGMDTETRKKFFFLFATILVPTVEKKAVIYCLEARTTSARFFKTFTATLLCVQHFCRGIRNFIVPERGIL